MDSARRSPLGRHAGHEWSTDPAELVLAFEEPEREQALASPATSDDAEAETGEPLT